MKRERGEPGTGQFSPLYSPNRRIKISAREREYGNPWHVRVFTATAGRQSIYPTG